MVSDKVAIETDKRLRDYELVLVINPTLAEEEFEAVIENVSRFVTGKGGSMTDIQRWGKKKLAYPIKHFTEGNYVLARFKLNPEFGRELGANLRISEAVMRNLLIKLED